MSALSFRCGSIMKIGVVADTHSEKIPSQLLKDFRKVDLIVHAGDFCSVADLEVFKRVGEVKSVYGNMDDLDLVNKIPQRLIFEAGGLRIGVVHGCGSARKNLEYVQQEFQKDKVDVVIFGHSHVPVNQMIDGVLYLNPGSPTDKVLTPYRSYAFLEIENRKAVATIIKVES